MRRFALMLVLFGCTPMAVPADAQDKPADPGAAPAAPAPPTEPTDAVLDALTAELTRSVAELPGTGEHPLHFMAYRAQDSRSFGVTATGGVLWSKGGGHNRQADVEIRVGTPALDSTHKLRDQWDWDNRATASLPVDDDVDAMRAELWMATDGAWKGAQERLTKVLANKSVKVEEEDQSDDFAAAEPSRSVAPVPAFTVDEAALVARAKALSQRFLGHPFLLNSSVSISAELEVRYFVSSEGHRIRQARPHARLSFDARTKADDGMELALSDHFDVPTIDALPADDVVLAAIDTLIQRLDALRTAPLVEPYAGPAIIMNRAAAVFFHEIFGHRIEGHRQRDVEEGQTFTKKVNTAIMPDFIDIVSDPSQAAFGPTPLNGTYAFDDEGVKAGPVRLVEQGVLKGFLMCRTPVEGFGASNGHGRANLGSAVVARQSNLLVSARQVVPFAELRAKLIEAVKAAGKDHGLIFHDISGGFTTTQRFGPQAFKVIPLYVVKVFPDGRPDQVVRGVDMVGTPLTSLEKIVAAGDDPGVFNGACGAESGWVPVAAVSPSLLVSQIEVEKKTAEQDRPPLLPPPEADPARDTLDEILDAEMARTTGALRHQQYGPPYYVAFRVDAGEWFRVGASFGASFGADGAPWRRFSVDLRVGDHGLDQTNFWGGWGGWGGGGGGTLPLEDDELAIRRELWHSCDGMYKGAIETLAQKKAQLQTMKAPDRPDDLQRCEPHQHEEPVPAFACDQEHWKRVVRDASRLFREYPALHDGSVSFSAGTSGTRYINNEGFRFTRGASNAWIQITARTQAADGMHLSDDRTFQARDVSGLPAEEALHAAIHELCQRVTATAGAPRAEEYIGPVLLEDEAVADFLLGQLINNLSNPREDLQGRGGTEFKHRLKRRITSGMLTVVDDPTIDTWEGLALLGGYAVDDDGVPAERITLVERGTLRTWYMSRVPTKQIKETNGHSRGGSGGPGNVIVTASETKARDAVVAELLQVAADQEMPYAMAVRRMSGTLVADRIWVADGRREPVRGARFGRTTLRALRDILRVAEGAQVVHRGGRGGTISLVTPPALLIEELELKQPETEEAKLPVLPHPFHAGKAEKPK